MTHCWRAPGGASKAPGVLPPQQWVMPPPAVTHCWRVPRGAQMGRMGSPRTPQQWVTPRPLPTVTHCWRGPRGAQMGTRGPSRTPPTVGHAPPRCEPLLGGSQGGPRSALEEAPGSAQRLLGTFLRGPLGCPPAAAAARSQACKADHLLHSPSGSAVAAGKTTYRSKMLLWLQGELRRVSLTISCTAPLGAPSL